MHRNTTTGVNNAHWLAALALGSLLWLGATVLSQALPTVVLGLELRGASFAWVALVQMVLGPMAVLAALRFVRLGLGDVGLVRRQWQADVAIGVAVAIAFAALQFLVIIPATGGDARSDVVANAAQIGATTSGLIAFIALAWAGSLSEELFFRGLLFNGLQRVFGTDRAAIAAAAAVVVVVFALLHGYQGWAGMIDTGLYGGLTMTLLYLWRGRRLTACIVAHACWNTIASTVIWVTH